MDAGKMRVLIVEDDESTAEAIGFHMRAAGFEAVIASDGLAGLRALRTGAPDAVVLDLMLPDLPGEEVCRRLRRLPGLAEIPVVFLSGRADSPDLATDDLGPVDLIAKPFDPADVVATVRRRLEERRA
jgi:DNA-binding response OmpR family regulator